MTLPAIPCPSELRIIPIQSKPFLPAPSYRGPRFAARRQNGTARPSGGSVTAKTYQTLNATISASITTEQRLHVEQTHP